MIGINVPFWSHSMTQWLAIVSLSTPVAPRRQCSLLAQFTAKGRHKVKSVLMQRPRVSYHRPSPLLILFLCAGLCSAVSKPEPASFLVKRNGKAQVKEESVWPGFVCRPQGQGPFWCCCWHCNSAARYSTHTNRSQGDNKAKAAKSFLCLLCCFYPAAGSVFLSHLFPGHAQGSGEERPPAPFEAFGATCRDNKQQTRRE